MDRSPLPEMLVFEPAPEGALPEMLVFEPAPESALPEMLSFPPEEELPPPRGRWAPASTDGDVFPPDPVNEFPDYEGAAADTELGDEFPDYEGAVDPEFSDD